MRITNSFSVTTTDGGDVLIGNPNITSTTSTWSNVTYFVPGPTSTSHSTGFANSTTASDGTTSSGFVFYGQVLLLQQDGKLQTLWFAVPTGTDGIYSLNWNETSDGTDAAVPVSLKTRPPTKPVVPPKPRQ